MDYEVMFWAVGGLMAIGFLIALAGIGSKGHDDQYHGIGFQETNIDDMEG